MTIKEALQELADEMKSILEDRIDEYGMNHRAHENTLKGSEFEKSIDIRVTDNGVQLSINSYWVFVSRGWERTGNYPGTFAQMVANVGQWVRRKGIRFKGLTENQVTWCVVKSIWTRGIMGRPFMVYTDDGDLTKMIPELEGYIDKWFDILFEAIITDLNNYFNG